VVPIIRPRASGTCVRQEAARTGVNDARRSHLRGGLTPALVRLRRLLAVTRPRGKCDRCSVTVPPAEPPGPSPAPAGREPYGPTGRRGRAVVSRPTTATSSGGCASPPLNTVAGARPHRDRASLAWQTVFLIDQAHRASQSPSHSKGAVDTKQRGKLSLLRWPSAVPCVRGSLSLKPLSGFNRWNRACSTGPAGKNSVSAAAVPGACGAHWRGHTARSLRMSVVREEKACYTT
jgi:hypothetical protein